MPSSPPRIAQIVTSMDVGGVPDHILTLVGELRRDHEITLVTGDVDAHNAAALDALGIEVVRLPAFRRLPDPTRDARLVLSLAKLMRERRFDLVHTHRSKAALAGAVAARLVNPRPALVNTAHILGSIAFSNPVVRGFFGIYDRVLLGTATDAVIVVSEAIRDQSVPARRHPARPHPCGAKRNPHRPLAGEPGPKPRPSAPSSAPGPTTSWSSTSRGWCRGRASRC